MPRLDADIDCEVVQSAFPSSFTFSAVGLDKVTADAVTLAVIARDASGSVADYDGVLNDAISRIVGTFRYHPRRDAVLLRVTTFGTAVDEVHGFKPVLDCADPATYAGIRSGGMTALNDAVVDAVDSVVRFGDALQADARAANGIVVVITDGCENNSRETTQAAISAIKRAVTGEHLESILVVLVRVGVSDPHIKKTLDDFAAAVGFTHDVAVDGFDSRSLAKLVEFVSQSISSTSQAVGSGGPSQAIPSI
jgi:uncharacterized protein YegL